MNDVYRQLAAATPAERLTILTRLLNDNPERRLDLPERDGVAAALEGVDFTRLWRRASRPGTGECPAPTLLRGADLRGANLTRCKLRGLDLGEADLRGAVLRSSDLRRARLEAARLGEADLAGADLRSARLGKADLGGALLEDADLRAASLRFASLRGAALDAAVLYRADLWGADLRKADLSRADLRRANLTEADLQGADLTGALLGGAALDRTNLRGAILRRAGLRGARLKRVNLSRAVLTDADLQGVSLAGCDLTHVSLGGAWLDKTRLGIDQLGGQLGEELAGNYAEAAKGYLALELNFEGLGNADAASWAYRRRRRMQKQARLHEGRSLWKAGARWRAVRAFGRSAADQITEWMCDYGESVPRVLASLLAVHLLFMLVYGATGSVVRVEGAADGAVRVATTDWKDLATFSLLAMTTSGAPAVGLQPANQLVHLLTGVQALIGISLTGLLGFVLGNRIRR